MMIYGIHSIFIAMIFLFKTPWFKVKISSIIQTRISYDHIQQISEAIKINKNERIKIQYKSAP